MLSCSASVSLSLLVCLLFTIHVQSLSWHLSLSMLYQIFFSAQVKRCAIVSYKHGIQELTSAAKFPGNLSSSATPVRTGFSDTPRRTREWRTLSEVTSLKCIRPQTLPRQLLIPSEETLTRNVHSQKGFQYIDRCYIIKLNCLKETLLQMLF